MAIINCLTHGNNGIVHVCPHIFKAVEVNMKIKVHSVKDDFFGKIYFCDECDKKMVDINKNDIEEVVESLDKINAVCFMCFKEWTENNQ